MADGAPSTSRRRSRLSYLDEADPRFSDRPADASLHGGHGGEAHGGERRRSGNQLQGAHKDAPRIAFTGEEFGFGYQAAGNFIKEVRKRKYGVYSGGISAIKGRPPEQEFREYSDRLATGENAKFDFSRPVTQPLRTKEQALVAVKQHTADFAVLPFYNPYFGYDFESLRALGAVGFLLGVEQIEADDVYCLAVHESQLYDLIQSAHPGTGFSSLQRRFRKSWGLVDSGSGNVPGADYADAPSAGLPIDMADQKLIRDRIDTVFAGPEAARRCKSKLDGMRAIGVDVRETPGMIEPHRELAKMARSTVNTARQTNTFFDPTTGETRFFSSLGADTQAGRLFGMVLPLDVADKSTDYRIIDYNFEDGIAPKTRFLVVDYVPDDTLIEDAYRTTDAKTRYWYRRLSEVARAITSAETRILNVLGAIGLALGLSLVFFGAVGASTFGAAFFTEEISKWLTPIRAQAAIGLGALAAAVSWLLLQAQGGAAQGVRVMFRFLRNATAASTADVENFLRNHGVRYAVVRTDEDSEGHEPAPIVLDVEFEPEHFGFNPLSIFSGRRLQNSVANGALKKAFARWKNRGVTVIAAMPIEDEAYQLPKPKQRRWWSEAVYAWAYDFVETMFVRFTRIAVYLIPLAFAALVIWLWLSGNL